MQEALPQFLNGCKSLLEKPDISSESDDWKQLEAIATDLAPVGGFIGQLTSEKLLLLAILQNQENSEKRKESLKMVFKNILNSVPDFNCIRIAGLLSPEELNECLVPYIYDQGPQGAIACYFSAQSKVKLPLQAFSYFLSARSWSKSDLINLSFLVSEQEKSKLIALLETSAENDIHNREAAEEFRFILFNESASQPLPPDIYDSPVLQNNVQKKTEEITITASTEKKHHEPVPATPTRIGTLKHPPVQKTKARVNKPVAQPEISAKNYALIIALCLMLPVVLFFFTNQSDELFSGTPKKIESEKAPEYWIDAVTQTKITPKFLDADKDYRMGELFLSRGQFAEAISLFEDALSRDPGHLQALFRLAYCRINIGDSNNARSSLIKLLQSEPRFQLANLLLARIAAMKNEADAAEKYYRKEFSLNSDLEVGIEFINFLNEKGKTSQAKEVLNVLQKKFPDRTILVKSEKDSPKGEKQ